MGTTRWRLYDELDADTGDGSDIFLIPSDCSVVWVTLCGGGAGGASSSGNPSVPGTGGTSAVPIVRYPLAVVPNGYLVITIGRGGLGAFRRRFGAYNSSATTRETETLANGYLNTNISGDILSAESLLPVTGAIFSAGFSGDSTNSPVIMRGYGLFGAFGTSTGEFLFQHTVDTTSRGMIFGLQAPSFTAETGKAAFSTVTSSGKAGLNLGTDSGIGAQGYTSALDGSYSNAPYGAGGYAEGLLIGPCGAGGGNPYGRGGAAGLPWVDRGQGGDATGYGAGGGGGCWLCPGGNGGDGFVLLEY